MKQKSKISCIIIFFTILILFLYSSVFSAQYVWDDLLLFVQKQGLIEEPLSWGLISGPVLPNTSYFRPLVFFLWYSEFYIFGLNPVVSHLIGLVVFFINNLLLFTLAYIIAYKIKHNKPLIVASIATLLYLTHPALIESTAWVSGRFDQLATLFSLAAFVVFSRNYTDSEKKLSWLVCFFIGFFYLCALLSKEVAVWLPLVLIVLYIVFESKKTYFQLIKDAFYCQYRLIFSLIIFLFIYFLLRFSAFTHHNIILSEYYIKVMILDNIFPLHAIKYYLAQIFLPFSNVSLLRPLDQLDQGFFSRFYAYVSGLLILTLFYLAIFKRKTSALLGLCAFFYIFLVLYFIPIGIANNIGHSRFLTLPMVFVVLAVVFLPYEKIKNNIKFANRKMMVLGGLIFAFWLGFSVLTVKTVAPFWSTEYSLWYWAYHSHPDTSIARSNYLKALISKKKFNEVIEICKQYTEKNGALEVDEQIAYATALYNVNDSESLDYFEGVISVLPKLHEEKNVNARKKADHFQMSSVQMSDAYALYALALIKFKGNTTSAVKNFKIAEWYLLDDEKELLNYYLSAALYLNQEYDEAMKLFYQQKIKTVKRGGESYIYTPAIIGQYCKSREKLHVCEKFSKEKF